MRLCTEVQHAVRQAKRQGGAQVHLCERRSSKYKLSDPGIDMIHKLDLQGLSEGTMVAEDLAGSPIETEVHRLSDAIRAHACAVANGLRLKKCVLAFRVRAAALCCHCSRAAMSPRGDHRDVPCR